eukprot:8014432-Heterocapsa_arctica.AAC.1
MAPQTARRRPAEGAADAAVQREAGRGGDGAPGAGDAGFAAAVGAWPGAGAALAGCWQRGRQRARTGATVGASRGLRGSRSTGL